LRVFARGQLTLRNPVDGNLQLGQQGGFLSLLIPTKSLSSVVQIGGTSFVFEQVKLWTLAPQEVVPGEQRGERIVIKRGISAGATVLAKEGVIFQ